MLDTQDAQVMPLISTKHFCGTAVPGDGGVSDEWPRSWFAGTPLALEARFCVDSGVPPMVCGTEFPELKFPTRLTGKFSTMKCEIIRRQEATLRRVTAGGQA